MSWITIKLPGPIPHKKNTHRIKKDRYEKLYIGNDKKYLTWKQVEKIRIVSELPSGFKAAVRCRIKCRFTFPDRKRRDVDNILSTILDLLSDCGIIEDDTWTCVPEINISCELSKDKTHEYLTTIFYEGVHTCK